MTKKYKLTDEIKVVFGRTLHRIQAIVSFSDVEEGELGGFVEKEANLSQDGDAWVSGDARVNGNAHVYGNAQVYGDARVSGNARVCGDAWVKNCTDILLVTPIGSENGTLTVTRSQNGELSITRGCFHGDLDEFTRAVEETHGDNEYGKQYQLIIELVKLRFKA